MVCTVPRRFANSLILLRFKPCIINEMAKNAEINIEQSQEETFEALSTFSLVHDMGKLLHSIAAPCKSNKNESPTPSLSRRTTNV